MYVHGIHREERLRDIYLNLLDIYLVVYFLVSSLKKTNFMFASRRSGCDKF